MLRSTLASAGLGDGAGEVESILDHGVGAGVADRRCASADPLEGTDER